MPGIVWGVIIVLVLFGLGARLGGVKLSFWKLLVAVAALAVAIALGATLAAR